MSWLGLKLLLVLTYIALGITAFRLRNRAMGILFYLLALLCFLAIIVLAMHRPW
jgi:uncharacterized membrane protein SirB2